MVTIIAKTIITNTQIIYAQIPKKMAQIRMILLDGAPVPALGAETYARASPENQGV